MSKKLTAVERKTLLVHAMSISRSIIASFINENRFNVSLIGSLIARYFNLTYISMLLNDNAPSYSFREYVTKIFDDNSKLFTCYYFFKKWVDEEELNIRTFIDGWIKRNKKEFDNIRKQMRSGVIDYVCEVEDFPLVGNKFFGNNESAKLEKHKVSKSKSKKKK